MRFWRRRSPGKHALGAAVTGIPSVVPQPVVTAVAAAPLPVPSPRDEPPAMIHATSEVARRPGSTDELSWITPVGAAPGAPAPVFVPSVQLGFRDGTYASLDPASAHSLALHALARAMTTRD